MTQRSTRLTRSRHVTGLACAALLAFACGESRTSDKPDASYRVAGQVVETSGSGPDARVVVAHEAIAAFKDRDGKPSDMAAMTMAFGLGPGLDLAQFKAGSKWQLNFGVTWDRTPVLRITHATPLPADTQLTLATDTH